MGKLRGYQGTLLKNLDGPEMARYIILTKKAVYVDFNEVVYLDICGFNDYICELIGEEMLQDISWSVIGTKGDEVILEVSGYVEDEEEYA